MHSPHGSCQPASCDRIQVDRPKSAARASTQSVVAKRRDAVRNRHAIEFERISSSPLADIKGNTASPRYAILFGPVSISNSYDPDSRQLIVEYLEANNTEAELARHVKPRRPFRARKPAAWDGGEFTALKDIEEVSRVVERIERDSKGVPILLRQYLKLGGRLLGFSADEQFNDSLDGLIMVDLRASDPRVLARYMGEEGAAEFLASHGIGVNILRLAS
jgi:hypothetical protein